MKKKSTPKQSAEQKVLNEIMVQNGFCGGLGMGQFGQGAFGQFSPFNLPTGVPFAGGEEVSQSTTLFKNLRWYLISNFRQLLNEMYAEIGVIQTIVDLPVDDALRGGVEFRSSQLEEDQLKELQVSMDRDNDIVTVGQTAKYNRLFGGAGTIILSDQDPEEPFDLASVDKDSNLSFRAVDMWELFWDKQNSEGYDPSIQIEDFEHYSYYGTKIHKTRVMRMKGIEAPSFIRPRLRGWGLSVLEPVVRSLNQYLKGTDLTFEVLDEFKVDVFKVKNLVNTLLSPNAQQKIHQRLTQANMQKNYQHAVVLDSEDDWDHKQLSFAGLAEVAAGYRKQLCADLRFPATKLFGSSEATGLGNADQNDMENYVSMVEAQVRNKIKYDILRVAEIRCQELHGMVPDDLEAQFKPLRILSAEQEENVKTQKFTRLSAAKTSGDITTLEFREGCNKGNLLDITLDNSGDELNPNDPEIQAIVTEGAQDPYASKDIDDPGANREDTQKSRLYPKGEYQGDNTKESGTPVRKPDVHPEEKATAAHLKAVGNKIPTPPPFVRKKNSLDFDKAAYEAMMGDERYDERKDAFFQNPGKVDEALWAKAKDASMKAFGKLKYGFVTYWYKKQGGTFH